MRKKRGRGGGQVGEREKKGGIGEAVGESA